MAARLTGEYFRRSVRKKTKIPVIIVNLALDKFQNNLPFFLIRKLYNLNY